MLQFHRLKLVALLLIDPTASGEHADTMLLDKARLFFKIDIF